ncbi:MAG: hypothetical protein Q4C45_01760 [Oscillospiraceae bacterium]|nr:hypothetical protein [Oscillospiraceae bacterium]
MDTVRSDFYRQEFSSLMRAVCTAIDALDRQEPEHARELLANAWDDAVVSSYKTFISETGR